MAPHRELDRQCVGCAAHHDPAGRYALTWNGRQRVLGRCWHCGAITQRRRLADERPVDERPA
jgi:hypothetical protein